MTRKINKIKRILQNNNLNHRDSDGGSSKSSNESNFMKDTSNIIKSTFINDNLRLNVSLPFNAGKALKEYLFKIVLFLFIKN